MSSGSLSVGALPRLLRDILVGRKSGALVLTRGDERDTLRFFEGQIVEAESNAAALRLASVLVARGLLSIADGEKAEAKADQERKPLHRLLLERQRLDRAQADEARKEQIRAVVQAVAGWSDGAFAFEETTSAAPGEDAVPGVQTGDLILETVRTLGDPDVVRFALGDLDRVVVHSTDPMLRFQKITPTPAEGYLLSRVDGMLSAREVVQLVPGAREEAETSLYALYCAGLIDLLELSSQPARAAKAAAARASAAPTPPPRSEARPPTAAPQAPAPAQQPPAVAPPTPQQAQPAASPAASARVEKLRQEIIELHRDLGSKNHFEILGLPRTAKDAQVKEAYFQLARRFHPDVHHRPELLDLRDQIEAIFIRLGTAFDVLKDPARRPQYEAMLGSPPRTGAAEAAPSAPSAAPTADDGEAEARLAEEAIRRAEKLYTQDKFWDAIQLVEQHLTKARGKTRSRGRVALARCYLKNPNWVKRAEEQLIQAVDEDPKHVDAHFLLGTMYLTGGLKTRALAKFKKVVELAPEHEEAKAKVAELASPEPPPEDPASGGIMKRFFGKS